MMLWMDHSPYLQCIGNSCQCIPSCIHSGTLPVDWCKLRHFGTDHLNTNSQILHTVCLCTQCYCSHRCNYLAGLYRYLRFCTGCFLGIHLCPIGTCHQSIPGDTDTWKIINVCDEFSAGYIKHFLKFYYNRLESKFYHILEVVLIEGFSMLTGAWKEFCHTHELLLYIFAQMFDFLLQRLILFSHSSYCFF